jgi:hypothetical protein
MRWDMALHQRVADVDQRDRAVVVDQEADRRAPFLDRRDVRTRGQVGRGAWRVRRRLG